MQGNWTALDCAVYWGHTAVVDAIVQHVRGSSSLSNSEVADVFTSAYDLAMEQAVLEDRSDVTTLLAQAMQARSVSAV